MDKSAKMIIWVVWEWENEKQTNPQSEMPMIIGRSRLFCRESESERVFKVWKMLRENLMETIYRGGKKWGDGMLMNVGGSLGGGRITDSI